MSLLTRFTNYIREQNLFQQQDRLLLAVSGGLDSVVLCELCWQANFHFEIAHCNFQLRGEESERDENFVRGLSGKYGVKIFVKRFDTKEYAAKNKLSIQVAARELRYTWFKELTAREQLAAGGEHVSPGVEQLEMSPEQQAVSSERAAAHASKLTSHTAHLLTAHHGNDNIETLLMNFFKGTGITGLRSMLPAQGKIIRPLLFATREEIRFFANENSLNFVEDSSNFSDKYTRNYFRHQLIPAVQKVFPGVEENLINNIERFREIERLYQQAIELHKKKLLEVKGNEIHIPVLKLLNAQPLKTIVYEIIKNFGFTAHQAEDVLHLLKSESGKYISSATHKIIKNRNWLIIAPINTMEAFHILIQENEKEIDFEMGKLKLKRESLLEKHVDISDSQSTATVEADEITFPLLLRKWRQGDYFYPLGMQKKKKLKKFLIDQKLSITEKEKVWVIESNKRIIWVVGKRIDNRFRVKPGTKTILQLKLASPNISG